MILGELKPQKGDRFRVLFPNGSKQIMEVFEIEQRGCVMVHPQWRAHKYFHGWTRRVEQINSEQAG